MSLLKSISSETETGVEGEEMPSLSQNIDTGDLCEVLVEEEVLGDMVTDVEKDSVSGKSSSCNVLVIKQPVLTPSAPFDNKELRSASESVVPTKREELRPPQTVTHGGSECSMTQDRADDSVTGAQVKDLAGDSPSLSHASNGLGAGVASGGAVEKSGDEGRPLSQTESPPPLAAEVPALGVKQCIVTTQKKPGSTSTTRSTRAPPVLQPEVITIDDDDEPVCDFEEPPLLLPEIAVTRKRKGIVRKRSFFGDTVDSSILKESIFVGSPTKKPNKTGTSSVTQAKPPMQGAFTSRVKEDGLTVLITRCGKSGGTLVTPKPRTPSKYGGDSNAKDRKKAEDQSARPLLINRQPLEKKSSHIVLSVKANNDQKTIITRDKPFCRRMCSGRQPSRRSGAARCRTSTVRSQDHFAGTAADKHVATGWHSIPPLALGDISTQCGYADISGHNREVFAPVPPPPGNLVAPPPDSGITARLRKVADGDELDSEGVFMSTALEGFLEEKAPLKLSFPVPDCYMPHEKLTSEEAEYPTPAQPTPTVARPHGEPRFKTLLEKQVWLGIRDQKDLKAARAAVSPSKDPLSSDAVPLYSLLLPPRYLSPARSARDLSVHRGRHLLPLSKVMHKSLDMRRAWDEPAKGADCVQFIYDSHHQVRIRGSGSLNDGSTTGAYGKLLRPGHVEKKLDTWLQNDYQVTTEAVSRQRAMLVAASVQDLAATAVSVKPSSRQQSPRTPRSSSKPAPPSAVAVRHSSRTPRPRRRLLLEDCLIDKKMFLESADADQASSAVGEEKDVPLPELEVHFASKHEDSIAEQLHEPITDKQDSVSDRAEDPATDHMTNEAGEKVDMGATANSVSGGLKDVDDDEEADVAHQHDDSHDVVSERANDADETEQICGDPQCITDPEKDVNLIEGENVWEEADGFPDEGEVSNQEEQDYSSDSEDRSVLGRREDGGADHEKDISTAQKRACLDVRRQNNAPGCREADLGQEVNDVEGPDQFVGVASHGNDDAKKPSYTYQQSKLVDQMESLVNDQSGAFGDLINALRQPLNEAKVSREAPECEAVPESFAPCQPTSPINEQILQQHNSGEAELQACLGPDMIKDLTAAASADPSCEDAVRNGRSEEAADSKTPREADASKIPSPTVRTWESTAADTSREQRTETKTVTHLAFFKSLLEKRSRPSTNCGPITQKAIVTDEALSAESGRHGEAVESDQRVVKTEEEEGNESVEKDVLAASPLKSTQSVGMIENIESEEQLENATCDMSMKMESPIEENVSCAKLQNVKEGRLSKVEEIGVCEKSSSDATKTPVGTSASDSAIVHANETAVDKATMDANDDGTLFLPTATDQVPPATNTEIAPKSEPLHTHESGTNPAVVRRACVHLPRFHLTAVRPYCMFHEVYDCEEYQPGGNCYMTPSRSRILQMQRNLAIRTGRLPPIPPRHQHAARTFGRVRSKMVRPRHMTDSCVAVLPVPDGTPLPPTRAPSGPRRLSLPENVRISQVREVVMLSPAQSADFSPCHGVLLHGGALVPIEPGSVHAGETWRMEPADNVIVTSADGRRFRNPPDRGCTTPVDVEDSVAEVVHLPLSEVNQSLDQGRMALTSGSDGGLTLTPARIRVMCRDRLRRVAVAQNGSREVFGTGSAVVMDNAGHLTVIGALSSEATPRDGAESSLKKRGAIEPVKDTSGGGSKHLSTDRSAVADKDDDNELQVIDIVVGDSKQRQATAGPKRMADRDASPPAKKRQRGPAEQRVGPSPKSNSEAAQRKALQAASQPRSSDGKFLPSPKKIKTSDTYKTAAKVAKKTTTEARTVVVFPKKCASKATVPETGPSSHLTPSWVMNRLHSVTVEVLQAEDESAIINRSPESAASKAVTSPTARQKSRQLIAAGKPSGPSSATGVLMSAVQKIAQNSTKPVKSPVPVEKQSLVKTLISPHETSQNAGGRLLPKPTQLESKSDISGEGPRKSKPPMKAFTPSAPLSSGSLPKSSGNVSPPRSLLKRSFIAESAVVPTTPISGTRSLQGRTGQSPNLTSRRKRPVAPKVSNETTLRMGDPSRPKVRRKSWADLPASRQSWANGLDAAKGAEEAAEATVEATVPRRRSWDNPAVRKSWRNSQNDRPRIRRTSENPEAGARQRLVADQAASRANPDPRLGEPQPTHPASAKPTPPREEPAARLTPPSSRPPPTLLRCDGVPVRGPSGGDSEPVSPVPAPAEPPDVVDLTTPEKAPPPPAEAALTPSARRRLKLPLEVTLLNESDMSDDGLDDLQELRTAVPKDSSSSGVYCPNIELIEL